MECKMQSAKRKMMIGTGFPSREPQGGTMTPPQSLPLRKLTIVNDTQSGGKSSVIIMKVPTLVGAEDHFGPWAGVGTGPYSAFVHSDVFTHVDCETGPQTGCGDPLKPFPGGRHITFLDNSPE